MTMQSLTGRVTMRGRLMTFIAASMLPLAGFIGASVVSEFGNTMERARSDVMQAAAFAAGRQAQVFAASRAVLDTLRRSSAVSIEGGPACEKLLAKIKDVNRQFMSIGVTDAAGVITCHNVLRKPQAFTDPTLIQRILSDGAPNFVVGNFMIGKVTGKPTVVVAAPMRDAFGMKNGMVFASLDLEYLAEMAATTSLGGRRSIAIVQPTTGRVLTHYPKAAFALGAVFEDHPLIAAMRSAAAGGVTESADFDGPLRIFGFVPIDGAETAGLMLAVGESKAVLLAPVRNHALLWIGLGAAAVTLALAMAWWLGNVLQLRPIAKLTGAAARIGSGDFGARVDLTAWQAPELRNLATTLNHMAQRLAAGREAERAVAASEARYRLLAENTADLVTCLDGDGRRIFASPASVEMLGRTPEELMNGRPEELIHPDEHGRLGEMMRRLRAGETVKAVQFRYRHADGHYIWIESSGRPAEGGNIVFAIRDISERRKIEESLAEANRRLAALASTDALTGLLNRRAFDAALDGAFAFAAAQNSDLSLLMIDVDRFKTFNDRYGHTAGDDCLRQVAAEFRRILQRPGISVARYGGEEFAVVLPESPLSVAIEAAEALRHAVRNRAIEHASSEHGVVTISVGIAALAGGKGPASPRELVRRADRALYAAKAGGRDRTEIGVGEMTKAS
ncbi:diguanylate cyclase [Aureimonas leprariae]|uniref:diguanylate cyclase n=1 Tax=Plantimonas leprariae TaxID=2615207 RepID=A0A7V7PP48_9HYPH|nr:diguanylate cyclase [Aureimonas leprariae]KAB0679748.1 diguanylate cyclase [Aureimonas leprariae]